MVLEGNLDFFLNQGTALRLIYERAEPFLLWSQFVRPVKDDKAAFLYRYDNVGMDSDPKKKKPAHVIVGGDFPEIDMSRPSVGSGLTESRGFMVRIKRNVIRDEPMGVSEVQRAYNFAGFWMARYMNDNILSAITGGATTPTWTPTAAWNAANATPVDDLIGLEEQMEREGYPYSLTDVFVHKTNWYELKKYLTSVDINEAKQRLIYGVPEIKKDQITVPVCGADVWKVKSGLSEGYALGLDRNNPCAELHYYVDSKFSQETVSYETVINGQKQIVEAANLGFHFEQIEDPDNHDLKLKFWVESKAVVTEAYAALYDNGI
ncbi:MAG: hypothetical protein WCX63_07160 [Methanoregula sp.]